MSILSRLRRRLEDLLISEMPGPYPEHTAPDVDGRRDSGDMGLGRASLEAQLQARGSAGTGGTIVSSPKDDFSRPPLD
jgi:hypothetical protein